MPPKRKKRGSFSNKPARKRPTPKIVTPEPTTPIKVQIRLRSSTRNKPIQPPSNAQEDLTTHASPDSSNISVIVHSSTVKNLFDLNDDLESSIDHTRPGDNCLKLIRDLPIVTSTPQVPQRTKVFESYIESTGNPPSNIESDVLNEGSPNQRESQTDHDTQDTLIEGNQGTLVDDEQGAKQTELVDGIQSELVDDTQDELVDNTQDGSADNTEDELVCNTQDELIDGAREDKVDNTHNESLDGTQNRSSDDSQDGLIDSTHDELIEDNQSMLSSDESLEDSSSKLVDGSLERQVELEVPMESPNSTETTTNESSRYAEHNEFEELYCICRTSDCSSEYMIECTNCNEYFHGRCVGVKYSSRNDDSPWYCPECIKTHRAHGIILENRRPVKRHRGSSKKLFTLTGE